jgi:hypothetical protein
MRQDRRRARDRVRMEREPNYRITARRDGTIRLAEWSPWLAAGGPLYTLLDARGRAGVGIADLTVVRDDDDLALEVIVDFRCGGDGAHRDALRDWAAHVGYRRIWFDGEVADLEPIAGGAAETRCTGCRARFVDAGAALWEFVRARGAFPTSCVLCGCDVAQWTPVRQIDEPADDPGTTKNARRQACR